MIARGPYRRTTVPKHHRVAEDLSYSRRAFADATILDLELMMRPGGGKEEDIFRIGENAWIGRVTLGPRFHGFHFAKCDLRTAVSHPNEPALHADAQSCMPDGGKAEWCVHQATARSY